jgi:hypothetical protein
MAIKRKLDEGDIAVLELFEDEVWFPEWLRSTADGESDKNLWPPQEWKHRDYQRMILTDRNKFVSLTGGRAIGKCEIGTARILTTEGYEQIKDLATLPSFMVYSLDEDQKLVYKRAKALPDKITSTYIIRTESNHSVQVTHEHPILTESGWKPAKEIKPGDTIEVITHIPHQNHINALRWHELRWLGYTIFSPNAIRLKTKFKPRFKRIGQEIEIIAERFMANWHKTPEGEYSLHKKQGKYTSPMRALYHELGMYHYIHFGNNPYSLPDILMKENNEQIAIFLEAAFAQYGKLEAREISLQTKNRPTALQLQELLLRFGIESKIDETYNVSLLGYQDVYKFWEIFKIPGVGLVNMAVPVERAHINEFMRLDTVTSVEYDTFQRQTYSLYVYDTNNYISGNIFVHNTVILEDKIIYEIVNYDKEFPMTPEQVLATANQAQLTPLLNKLIQRFTGSRLLSGFLYKPGGAKGGINKADGTMTFPVRAKPFTFFFRIAGSKGEQNMVGLHIPRIKIDEAQIFPPTSFTQLLPAFNHWEPKTQLFVAGVPNGLRNSVLFQTDQKDPKYKRYRIPSHNNPFYTKEQDIINLREWGGEQDDRYQQLALGRHGAAAFQVISRDDISVATYPFSNYRYNSAQKLKGIRFSDVLQTPKLPDDVTDIVMAIDPGFVDPTVIHIIGKGKTQTWRTYMRYTLMRVDFNEQTIILDWIATAYNVGLLAIDIGAGGNGASLLHNLVHDERYKSKNYSKRARGINFSEKVLSGYTADNEELTMEAKNHAANVLVRIIQDGELEFSSVDFEGISQIERIAKQKTISGRDRYFVLSERGSGADSNDHIFASYLCFALALDYGITNEPMKKLGQAIGSYT